MTIVYESNTIIFAEVRMDELLGNISFSVNSFCYLKDPQTSDLGKRILRGSIDLIDELGLEDFTFKKLASYIGSTEASVYRYFENKHKLLLYLTVWYWLWLEYRLVLGLANIESVEARLCTAIRILAQEVTEDGSIPHINEQKLNRIVIAESSKVYLTKLVDEENQEGIFAGYKRLVERLSQIVLEYNPEFKYPHMLFTTVIEGAHFQRYFAKHLPRLTDVVKGEDAIVVFYQNMVMATIQKENG